MSEETKTKPLAKSSTAWAALVQLLITLAAALSIGLEGQEAQLSLFLRAILPTWLDPVAIYIASGLIGFLATISGRKKAGGISGLFK